MRAAYIGIDILYPALTSLWETGCDIVKIFTCNTDNYTEFNTEVTAFAVEHNIPLQTERVRRQDLHDLVAMGCDFVLCAGYYHVVPVIDELRIVNLHPALLPQARGGWPMPQTILKGLTESGLTMHRMTAGLDEGAIIIREVMPVYPDTDNLQTFTERQHSLIPEMVRTLVSDFDRLWNEAIPQSEEAAEYWEMPTREDFSIDDTFEYQKADLILRAFYGYEVYYTDTKTGRQYELIGASAHQGQAPNAAPGQDFFSIKGGYISSPRTRCL